MRVLILGSGRLGRGLQQGLRGSDHDVEVAGSRARRRLPPCDVVILAVPDSQIRTVATTLAGRVGRATVVLHCAGSLPATELAGTARDFGAMHPLVSFADPRRPPPLTDTTFVIAGTARAVRVARAIARACGAQALVGDVHGPLYHAAAAMVAGGSVALAFEAVQLLEALGISRKKATTALGGLLSTVAYNVGRVGVPAALTGPIVRGDRATIRAHRRAISGVDGGVLRTYDAIAVAIRKCALDRRA